MKNLITKKSARIAAAALAATVTFGAMAFALSYKPAADSYTIASEDGGYYSETTYYLTEEAFGEYESGKQASKPAAKTMSASSESTSESEQEVGEFVMGVAKSVWVMEELDEDGNVVDSQLLTKDEMDDYGISTMGVKRPWFDQVIIGGGGGGGYPDEEIGSDSQSFYQLTIDAVVTYNKGTKEYSVDTDFSWESDWWTWPWEADEEAESSNMDYIGITWGGDGTYHMESKQISGTYYDNSDIEFLQCDAEPYWGYVWQFHEQKSFFAPEQAIKNASAKIDIKKVGEIENKDAKVRITYIHTYTKVDIGVTITIGEEETEAKIDFLQQGSWELVMTIDGLIY